VTACLDTDVIIRFLTGDDPEKQRRSGEFFHRVVTGETSVVVTLMAIADAVFVLTSRNLYGISRFDASEMLISLITHPGFVVEHKSRVIVALTIFRTHDLDFGDAYTAATALEDDDPQVVSYDRDFDRITGISRVSP
jgi:predicted nucleic acid-binding protein